MELFKLTAHELHDKLVARETSSTEITRAVFDRIEATESKVQAYLTLTKDLAFEQAAAVDAALAKGEHIAPLAGIPGAIKDNLCIKGIRTTCASKMLEHFVHIGER